MTAGWAVGGLSTYPGNNFWNGLINCSKSLVKVNLIILRIYAVASQAEAGLKFDNTFICTYVWLHRANCIKVNNNENQHDF